MRIVAGRGFFISPLFALLRSGWLVEMLDFGGGGGMWEDVCFQIIWVE